MESGGKKYVFMTSIQFQNRNSASGKQDDWVEFCSKFAKELFPIFRSHPTMVRVVEGSPIKAGKWNLRRLKKNRIFHDTVKEFSTSDTIGSPQNLIKFTSRGRAIDMNPTSLRYVNNVLNFLELFGPSILSPNYLDTEKGIIVEIGGGYGGECKMANDLALKLFGSKIDKRWNIFDLDSSVPLLSRWLDTFGYEASINPTFVSSSKIILVVSNAAFSEMDRDLQEKYFNEIILSAQSGYIIENFSTFSARFGGFTREEFIDRLKNSGKNVMDLNPRIWLSDFDKEAGTGLIVFSTKSFPKFKKYLSLVDMTEISTKWIRRRINKEGL